MTERVADIQRGKNRDMKMNLLKAPEHTRSPFGYHFIMKLKITSELSAYL